VPLHRRVAETETRPRLASREIARRNVEDGWNRPRHAAAWMVTLSLGRRVVLARLPSTALVASRLRWRWAIIGRPSPGCLRGPTLPRRWHDCQRCYASCNAHRTGCHTLPSHRSSGRSTGSVCVSACTSRLPGDFAQELVVPPRAWRKVRFHAQPWANAQRLRGRPGAFVRNRSGPLE